MASLTPSASRRRSPPTPCWRPINDLKAIERSLLENQGQVAAVILEPVIGNAGPILPDEGYLQGLRELTARHDVLLIFDEVNTGFRLAMGGAQQYYGVRPDMTVLGKIAGGGLPIGIYGASREIMSDVSPTGEVYQAGTFSGNPLSLTAGIETIRVLGREGHDELARKGEHIRQGLVLHRERDAPRFPGGQLGLDVPAPLDRLCRAQL